jgi:predicted outer membrane repeat protein
MLSATSSVFSDNVVPASAVLTAAASCSGVVEISGVGGSLAVIESGVTLDAVTISGSSAPVAGGLYASQSQVAATRLNVHDNFATELGGAVSLEYSSSLFLLSTFARNNVKVEIKSDVQYTPNPKLGLCDYIVALSSNCTEKLVMCQNTDFAQSQGGAIHCTGPKGFVVKQTVFTDNTAGQGGAVYALQCLTDFDAVTFTGNSACRGGGLEQSSAGICLKRSTFSNNVAITPGTLGGGGAVLIANAASKVSTISLNTFTGNSSPIGQGGVFKFVSAGAVSLANNTYSSNSALSGGVGYWYSTPPKSQIGELYPLPLNTAVHGAKWASPP